MIENIKASLLESKSALESFLSNQQSLLNVEAASAALIATFENKGKVYSCGNGGSMGEVQAQNGVVKRLDATLWQSEKAELRKLLEAE